MIQCAEAAGFRPVRVQLEVEVADVEPVSWSVFLKQSGNPLAPSHGDAMRAALSADETKRLEDALRPLVEAGQGTRRTARAYLTASKPLDPLTP